MVLVAQTVVHKGAVVVESLHTLVAVVAVHCVLGAQILTVDADVVQVQLLVHKSLHQSQEISLHGHISRVFQRQTVKEDGDDEEYRVEQNDHFVKV